MALMPLTFGKAPRSSITSARCATGEFGSTSPANLEVWHRDIPPKSQWPINDEDPIVIHKNITYAVFRPDYWLGKPQIDRVFGRPDNLPDMVQAGQFIGAEGLRYEIDALRRKGKRLGGFTSFDYNEPWTNGAGSYLVDYDGRTLMNYDFYKQAVAPSASRSNISRCCTISGQVSRRSCFSRATPRRPPRICVGSGSPATVVGRFFPAAKGPPRSSRWR